MNGRHGEGERNKDGVKGSIKGIRCAEGREIGKSAVERDHLTYRKRVDFITHPPQPTPTHPNPPLILPILLRAPKCLYGALSSRPVASPYKTSAHKGTLITLTSLTGHKGAKGLLETGRMGSWG